MTQDLSRRSFLRATTLGGGVLTVGLPLLEVMLNSTGTAYADESALPACFGIWFTGNGVAPEAFVPATTGTEWRLPAGEERLQLLYEREPADRWSSAEEYYSYTDQEHAFGRLMGPEYRNLFTLVSGLTLPTPHPQHLTAQPGILAGCPETRIGDKGRVFGGPTADQRMATLWRSRSLVMEMPKPNVPESDVPLQRYTSWKQSDEAASGEVVPEGGVIPVNPHFSARSVFEDLFGSGPPLTADETHAKQSILDYLLPQIERLKTRASSMDRQRLEEHFTSLREIEADLNAHTNSCSPDEPPDPMELKSRHLEMVRMTGLALSCGVRNVFSLTASNSGSQFAIPGGGGKGQHSLQHGGFLGDGLNTIDKLRAAIVSQNASSRALRLQSMKLNRVTVRYEMDLYADMIEHFASIPHGAGPLLDACAIVGGFELWDGNHHGYEETPVMVAGTANGRLRMGHHIRDNGTTKASDVTLSAMRAAAGDPELVPHLGIPNAQWGWLSTDGYPELEV